MKRPMTFVLSLFLVVNVFSSPSANAVLTNPSPVCASGTCTVNFSATADYYLWSAPAAGTYTFQVWGAQGGSAISTSGTVVQTGPLGGYASGNYTLTSGQTLYIYVGGQGAGSTSQLTAIAGGFNGGGIGYNGDANARAASGGGASDIRVGGNSLSNRVIVAGAGGGGRYFPGYGSQVGGHGGGTSGGNGDSGGTSSAKGGTQSAGGAGGQNGGTASPGTLGNGGNGISSLHIYGSSGGGGGYYGGGGAGVGFTPGGGSGYVGGVTASTITAGNASMPDPAGGNMVGRSGNGYIRISYVDATPPAFTSFELAGGSKIATFRSAIVITATVTIASKMTFRANGKVLPGCKNKTAIGSGSIFTATCSWRPSVRGSVAIHATADPIADGIDNATSSTVSVGVSGRTDKR
jgi:hypothetical protein